MATKAQLAVIHVAVNHLEKSQGFSDESYRDLLQNMFGVRSSKDLDRDQVHKLLREFRKLGWQNPPGPLHKGGDTATQAAPPDAGAPITGPQQKVIADLYRILDWPPGRQVNFNRRIIKRPWPQDHANGQKIIYALIAIAAPKLLQSVNAIPEKNLTRWEVGFIHVNEKSAVKELGRFVGGGNRRGRRRMPEISMTKLFEILDRRGAGANLNNNNPEKRS